MIQYVHKTTVVCGKIILINKALVFEQIHKSYLNFDSMYEFYPQKAVCVCVLKEELYIVSSLLLKNLKMYFYGIIVTKLLHSIIWL